MRPQPKYLIALLVAGLSAPAGAVVEVDFKGADSYTDAGTRGYGGRANTRVLEEISAHLQALGARYLAPDQHLTVEIRDVDLAGRFEPWHSYAYDVRFMREITWPRIELHYVLREGERILAERDESVMDMQYLRHANGYFDSDRLRYEKRMLDDWFRSRFARAEIGNAPQP